MYVCVYVCVCVCRPVARGGSGGSIEPPISGSVYCAVQSVHSMPHGFGRSNPPFRGVYTAQYSQYTLCHTGLAGDRVHVYTISSNVAQRGWPHRVCTSARGAAKGRTCIIIIISNITNVSHMMASKASAMDGQWREAPA